MSRNKRASLALVALGAALTLAGLLRPAEVHPHADMTAGEILMDWDMWEGERAWRGR